MYTIHVTPRHCPFCEKAKTLLKQKGLPFQVAVADTPERLQALKNQGFMTVPQIYLGDQHIGGYTELAKSLGETL